jgi:hypothetical protein
MNGHIRDPVDFIGIFSLESGNLAPSADEADSPDPAHHAAESVPSFCMTEDALSRIEAALRVQVKRRIPRAGQLPPVCGLPAVASDALPQSVPPSALAVRPSSPLAPDHLRSQFAAKHGRFNLLAASTILIVGALTAALAHHFFTSQMSGEPAIAKISTTDLSSLPAPTVVSAPLNHRTIDEAADQRGDKSSAPNDPPVPAPQSTSSATSPPSIPASSRPLHPRLGKTTASAHKSSAN